MHIFKSLILFLLIIHGLELFAQLPTEKQQKQTVEFVRDYQFQPNARNNETKTINELLQFISEGSGKLRVFTTFRLSASVHLLFETDSLLTNKHKAFVEVLNPLLSGDTEYKDFQLDQYLLPPFVKIEGVAKSDSDGEILATFSLDSLRWISSGRSVEKSFTLNLSEKKKENVVLEVIDVSFFYGDDYLEKVVAFKNAFADYYAAENTLEKITSVIEDIDTSKYESIILDEFRLCEAEVLLNQLLSESFFKILPLEKSDPAKVIPQSEALKLYIKEMRRDFNNTISYIDTIFYHGATNHLRRGDTLKARDYFGKSLVYNSYYMPSHIGLGRLNLYAGNVKQAMEPLRPILGNAPMPGKWKSQTLDFLSEVYSFQKQHAQDAMADGRFLEALKILSEVEAFCQGTQQWDCPEDLFLEIEKVHYGMYRSYLSVAARAYTSYNNEFAVSYIESALAYKEANSKYISDDSEAFFLLEQVLDGYYVLASKAAEANDFVAAASNFKAAADLCARYPSLNCADNTNELARQAEKRKTEAEILTLPLVIKEPPATNPIHTPEEALEKVKDLLSKGHLSAWAGEPDKAREYLNQLLPIAIRHDLRQDTIINQRIVGLTSMIAEKDCEIKKRELESLLKVIHDYFEKGYYVEARNNYDLAKGIQNDSFNCSWSYTDSLSAMSYVTMAAEYQNFLYAAQKAYFNARQGDYDDFFVKYETAGVFFEEHKLQDFGLKHETLAMFAVSSENSSLVRALIEPLADSGQTDDVLLLLLSLKDQGFDPRELRSLLQYAGNKAAVDVHAQNTEIKPAEWLKEKTRDDPWFKLYDRGFLNSWPKE